MNLGLDKIEIEGFEETKEKLELHPRDILDDDISEVDLEELRQIQQDAEHDSEGEPGLSKEMLVQLKLAEEAQKKESEFMNEILKKYNENKESAKAFYYYKKLNFEFGTEEGTNQR